MTGRAPGAPLSQLSNEAYSESSIVSDMLRRELDSRFLNSTPNLGSLLPPPPLSAIPGPAKLLDPMYRPMMHPPMAHGLPGLNPSPYPSHSVGYVTSAAAPSMTVSSITGQPSSSGGILSNLGGMSIPTTAPNLSLPSKTVNSPSRLLFTSYTVSINVFHWTYHTVLETW